MKKLGWVVPLLGTILMGLSTWVLITNVKINFTFPSAYPCVHKYDQ